MAIIINIDVMMAKRKMSLGELAERVDITPANLSILKTGKRKPSGSRRSKRSAASWTASRETSSNTARTSRRKSNKNPFIRSIMRKITMLVIAAFAVTNTAAQFNPQQPIPADKDVRTGKLENGMTYYIRHNEKPKGQADFYILHDVGAIQENDSQQGLAHFLEHMAFNGTKNLPGKR